MATGDAASAAALPAARPAWQDALLPLAVLAALATVPLVAGGYLQDLVVKIVILAIFALSLELLVGTTGLVSLGHAAFFGIGAYAVVLASPASEPGSLPGLLALSMACAAGYALFVGALSLRTRGVYFIMVTLAFAQMAYFIFHDTKLGGGSDGIYLNVKPVLGPLLDLERRDHFYFFALAALAGTYGLLALLLRSRFGHALAGIRINEQRMRAVGFRTYGYKLAAFVVAGALAGLAGFLIAVRDGFVNPEMLAWHESGAVLLMLILGGLGHLRGAVLGAAAFTLLRELYASEGLVGRLATHWQLTLGITIIVLVATMPRGLYGLPAQWRRARLAREARAVPEAPLPAGDVLLQAERLTRRFGGLAAVDDVSLDLRRGEVHALIGTNGAGKSTLVNMLSGELVPSAGRIRLAGADITAWSQPHRARAGVGRSYQRTNIFDPLSVHENARLSAQAAQQRPWAVWERARDCRLSRANAAAAIEASGLGAHGAELAGFLSHGGKRQLEIAMCLATRPQVLLLDEPLAGMGAEETERMLGLLVELKRDHAILLVEHDMDAVFRVADRITVMVNGQVIATDRPERIRANPEVRVAYLGEDQA